MIIKCFRCGKEIDTPDNSNADYVIGKDMVVKEEGQEIQKTGIICPKCHKEDDIVIWGVHKNDG